MKTWPDQDGTIVRRYVQQLPLRGPKTPTVYRGILSRFQDFVLKHAPERSLDRETIDAWLRDRAVAWPLHMVLDRARLIDRFLDWLASNQLLAANPLAQLRQTYGQRATTPIVRALLSPNPTEALEALRPLPRWASHLGPVMQEHLHRLHTLGYRCRAEGDFLRFDRFLQTHRTAADQPLAQLVREWASLAATPRGQLDRWYVGRALTQALRRTDPSIEPIAVDRRLIQEVQRQQRRPYIYTVEEVKRLLDTARGWPSPKAPLRPITLYTMFVLAYCAGLRLGEIVRSTVGDIHLEEATIDIRQTKFFKSRRLPLAPSVMATLRQYLEARQRARAPSHPQAPLFWHEDGEDGYSYSRAGQLLRAVIGQAGLKPTPGRVGPRIHDLRHAFVVHRMLAWYREGINPQSRLSYLATYLGHRDIHSTLVYLTITEALLRQASDRFHVLGAEALGSTQGGVSCPQV